MIRVRRTKHLVTAELIWWKYLTWSWGVERFITSVRARRCTSSSSSSTSPQYFRWLFLCTLPLGDLYGVFAQLSLFHSFFLCSHFFGPLIAKRSICNGHLTALRFEVEKFQRQFQKSQIKYRHSGQGYDMYKFEQLSHVQYFILGIGKVSDFSKSILSTSHLLVIRVLFAIS